MWGAAGSRCPSEGWTAGRKRRRKNRNSTSGMKWKRKAPKHADHLKAVETFVTLTKNKKKGKYIKE